MNNTEVDVNKGPTAISAHASVKLKAIAIVLMVVHHLFGLKAGYAYISTFSIHGIPAELIIGRFGKICVAMFLFLSGYGFSLTLNYKKYTFKKNLNKIVRFYLQYVLVFAIFIPYGLYEHIFSWKPTEFTENLLTISSSYNGAWWFVNTYINILLFYPLFIYITKDKTYRIIILSIIILSLAVILQLYPNTYPLNKIGFMKNTFIWQVIFFQGYIFAKDDLFKYFRFINTYFLCAATIILIIVFRSILPVNFSVEKSSQVAFTDFFLTPLFIFCLIKFLSSKQSLLYGLGAHSTNIWLTHIFFQYTYFSKLVFYPQLSILILLLDLALAIAASYAINFILQLFRKQKTDEREFKLLDKAT